MTIPPVQAAALFAVVFFMFYVLSWRERRTHNLPPGPKRLPLLGNILQFPSDGQHLAFMQWGAKYGDVIYAEFFHQPVVILNSARAAFDLVEKRSTKYSERPRFRFLVEMVGWHGNVVWAEYGDRWRQHRRWYRSAFLTRQSLDNYPPLQRKEVHKLMLNLVQDPAGFRSHLRRLTFTLMLEIGYGCTVTPADDEFLHMVDNNLTLAFQGTGAGSALVDFLPILAHLPTWMPGAGCRRTASIVRPAITAAEDVPYAKVKDEMSTGTAKPSFTTAMIDECTQKGHLTPEDERQIKGAAGTLYTGGTDTTLTPMVTFILAMVLNPEVVKKAQEEIDRVVGNARLPDFGDRDSLPYIDCIVMEIYRYCPSAPLAVPHRASEDDVYRGYHIPKDSTILLNAWAMCRDPEVYPEPNVFRPERYLNRIGDKDPGLSDPRRLVFGWGRRICPGRLLADGNVWLVVASILATMDIRKARDAQREEITPTPTFTSGAIIRPGPFVCDIRPRSEKARELILTSASADV